MSVDLGKEIADVRKEITIQTRVQRSRCPGLRPVSPACECGHRDSGSLAWMASTSRPNLPRVIAEQQGERARSPLHGVAEHQLPVVEHHAVVSTYYEFNPAFQFTL